MNLPDGLTVAGGVLEVLGVFLMANAYVNAVRLRDLPAVLLSALVRGPRARGAVALKDALSPEDRVQTLQGLLFIALGFTLQLVRTLVWPS